MCTYLYSKIQYYKSLSIRARPFEFFYDFFLLKLRYLPYRYCIPADYENEWQDSDAVRRPHLLQQLEIQVLVLLQEEIPEVPSKDHVGPTPEC